mmetsp:Transcript_7650/g.11583  ORF Transcript_7650/g.11583 Transcript_7650/m.11583 type:complete len:292 (+) Transcript_7650:46-921(+)
MNLERAVRLGDLTRVKELVKEGNNVNEKWKYGSTPLHWAVKYGHSAVANFLLENKADIESEAKNGRTPLHWAAEEGDVTMTTNLLEKKANIEPKAKNGRTPLHEAAWNGHGTVVKHLLDNKANIHSKSKLGWTPLHTASCKGNLNVVKYLLENKANVDSKALNGLTALDLAKVNERKDIVQFFQSLNSTDAEETVVNNQNDISDTPQPKYYKKANIEGPVPKEFKCPLTHKIMEDPVMTSDGVNYDRHAITKWLSFRGSCPLTGKQLTVEQLNPNYSLKKAIENFKQDKVV